MKVSNPSVWAMAYLAILAAGYAALIAALMIFVDWIDRRDTAADTWWLPGRDNDDEEIPQ